jgi:subtilisin
MRLKLLASAIVALVSLAVILPNTLSAEDREHKYSIPIMAPQFAVRSDDKDIVYRLPTDEMQPQKLEVVSKAAPVQWWAKQVAAPECWAKGAKGQGKKVAVLDTGVDINHVDLKGRIREAANFTRSSAGSSDVQGHGTHCAGIVVGIAPEVDLYCGKVLGDNGSGTSSQIAAGIDWAVSKRVDVISMSLGSPSQDSIIQAACERATRAGVIVVAAAGNSGPGRDTVEYPGGFAACICVAATDSGDRVASFSSRGAQVYVAAPGVDILSAYPGDRRATMSGTSMATPGVAGALAVVLSSGPDLTPETVRESIKKTAKDIPPTGRDPSTGFGLIQPLAMLSTKPTDPTDPIPSPTRIELREDDFTPSGWEKIRRINPKIDSVTFVIKP